MRRIKRSYNGMPVKDAKANLTVVLVKEDLKGATRKDPSCCVFAQACKRLFKGAAIFYKKVAYIELPDEDGTRYIHRYKLTSAAMEFIAEYDRTGKFPIGVGVNLLRPPKSCTLDTMRRYHHKHFEKINAINKLKRKHGIERRAYTKAKPRVFDKSVRNGTGSMHLASFRIENGE